MHMTFSAQTKRRIAMGMLGLATLMAIDGVYQLVMHVRWRTWMPDTLTLAATTTQPATTQPTTQANDKPASTKPAKPPELAAVIKRRNIFTKPGPTGHGLTLTGVLGRTALFNGRSGPVAIEEGKSEQNVTVKSIDGYTVVIEYKGKAETMRLFDGKQAPKPPTTSAPSTDATASRPAHD